MRGEEEEGGKLAFGLRPVVMSSEKEMRVGRGEKRGVRREGE